MRYKLFIAGMLMLNFSYAQEDSLYWEKVRKYYSGFQSYFFIHGYHMFDSVGNLCSYMDYNPYSVTDSIAAQEMYNRRYETFNDTTRETHYVDLDFFNDYVVKNTAPLFPRIGKHVFNLDRISNKKRGAVTITKITTYRYRIKGYQDDGNGNYVCIDGYLKPMKKGTMKFTGEITSRLSINTCEDEYCKKGEFTFLCIPGRNFWRLQEADFCEERRIDYLDVFF